MAKTDIERLIQKHEGLTHSEDRKVLSHVQREKQDWILNTIMIEGCDIPFQFKRKKLYQKLKGARVNLTYYPDTQKVAGMEFEFMKVVRIRVS
ncbi:MAG: hypothetical protein ACI9T9_000929 [Oleiphilaceae bacterium]|jgi:hypothetical protein